jgi:hypothetical protein
MSDVMCECVCLCLHVHMCVCLCVWARILGEAEDIFFEDRKGGDLSLIQPILGLICGKSEYTCLYAQTEVFSFAVTSAMDMWENHIHTIIQTPSSNYHA